MIDDFWAKYAEVEDAFYRLRVDFWASDDREKRVVEGFSGQESERVLRLIDSAASVDARVLVVALPFVVDMAIDGPMRSMGMAEKILSEKYSDDEVRREITLKMPGYISSNDYFLYRRLAQILKAHRLGDLLANLMLACRNHADHNIREIGDDFRAPG